MLRGEPCAEVLDLAEPAGLREVACVHEHVAARQLAEATVLAVRVRDAHEAHGRLVSLRWEPPKPFNVKRLATAAATLDQRRPRLLPREAVERYGQELGRRAVGSGPFRLASIDSARRRVLPSACPSPSRLSVVAARRMSRMKVVNFKTARYCRCILRVMAS